MKELFSEIRMLIAEKLLSLAFKISSNDENGKNLKKAIADYFNAVVYKLKK